ncbi:MAG: PHP domain-containing protein, partial [Ruminiclostridium sp.]|nr:PHP domain-containing protein [Ruminiclostridium sp.]
MPERNPTFFEMFSPYHTYLTNQQAHDLLAYLESWVVTGAVLDSAARTIEADILCPELPPEDFLTRLEQDLAGLYQVNAVRLRPMAPAPAVCCQEEARAEPQPEPVSEPVPEPEPQPVPEEPPMSEQERAFRQTEALRQKAMKEAQAAHEAERVFSANRIFGSRQIKKKPIPMNTLELDMGVVTVQGDVFAVEHKELKRRNAWVVGFDITDYTSSIRVNKFMSNEEAAPIVNGIKTGMHLKISGRLNLNRFDNDMVLEPLIIETADKPKKKDNAPEKRVELHLHTRMSLMDALTETKDVVKRAISWGHPAIAITDHGVAQSFPDAWSAGKGKIKVLLGTEAYYINDVDDKLTLRGPLDQDLDGPIVCFDLETTGLDKKTELITEIGAVVLENGEVKEKFQTFVDPMRPLAPNIVQL